MPRGFSLKRKSGSKSGGSSPLKDDGNFIIKQDGENEQYSVAELAKLYFRSPGYPPHFTRTEIKQPLLKATPDEFKVNAQKLWKTLLVFTKDIADYRRSNSHSHQPNLGSVMTRMYRDLGITPVDPDLQAQSPVLEKATGFRDAHLRHLPNKPQRKTLLKLRNTLTHRFSIGTRKSIFHTLPLEHSLISPLDHIHYIIGYCILKHELRDEVYSFVCKQLINNPVRDSVNKYWTFLSLLIGCCPPSPFLVPYVQRLIASSPPIHGQILSKLLQRTLKNGTRCQPPAYIEIEAAMEKRLLELQITFMDGTAQSLVVDAATTSEEVIQELSDRIGMKTSFGFSLYISMLNKVASLGCNTDHVLDSISQCEQIFRDQDGEERNAPWRLFFRKEVFSPWDDFSSDFMATNLIFAQLTRGIMLGEYVAESDQEMAVLAAQQYFIDYGGTINEDSLSSVLPSYIPPDKRQSDTSLRKWHSLIVKAYRKLFDNRDKLPSEQRVKTDLIHYARKKWALPFSKLYDVVQVEGPFPLEGIRVKLGINCQEVFLMTEEGEFISKIPFEEISTVTGEMAGSNADLVEVPVVMFVFHTGTILKLGSMDSPDIRDILNYMMDGIKRRSVWALARATYYGDDPKELNVEEGDLIQLSCKAQDGALRNKHTHAKNMTTGKEGILPSNLLYVLPTESKPSQDFVNLHKSTRPKRSVVNFSDQIMEIPRMDLNYETESEGFQHSSVRLQDSLPSTGSASPVPGTSRDLSHNLNVNGIPNGNQTPSSGSGSLVIQNGNTSNGAQDVAEIETPVKLLSLTENGGTSHSGAQNGVTDGSDITDTASSLAVELPSVESSRL